MMLLKHSDGLVYVLEFMYYWKNGSEQSPAPQSVYQDLTDVLGWERRVLSVKKAWIVNSTLWMPVI